MVDEDGGEIFSIFWHLGFEDEVNEKENTQINKSACFTNTDDQKRYGLLSHYFFVHFIHLLKLLAVKTLLLLSNLNQPPPES